MIRIITDSTCDIDKQLLADYDLTILPLKIIINGHEYTDTVDIQINEVYEAMRQGIVPKTTQITYDDVYACFDRFCQQGDDLIYLAFSKAMSGCYTFANLIAEDIRLKYPRSRLTIIDSRCGSGALGLMVLQALKMAELNDDYTVITATLQDMAQHVELIFTLTDLNWIAKGGRLSRTAGYAGTLLNIKPILEVDNGQIITTRAVRGRNHSIAEVAQEIARRAAGFPDQLISITHADDIEMAYELEKQLNELLPHCQTTITCIGAVLGVHLGIGGVGVYCFNSRPDNYLLLK